MDIQKLFYGQLPELVNNFAGNILAYALLLAAVATITMSFVELIKSLLYLRLSYHKTLVRDWLYSEDNYRELLILTVAGVDSADALFDQPTDKMMGQIQSAANVAIDFPEFFPSIYKFFTQVPLSQAAQVETGESGIPKNADRFNDADIWAEFIRYQKARPSEDDIEIREATQARARIDHFLSRKLDAFQTRTEYKWARKNQYYAVIAASVFLMGILLHLQVPILFALLLSFFGGMMSPLAKDVVSAISGLKVKA